MHKPDVTTHNPSSEYLRELISLLDMTQIDIAEQLGLPVDTFRRYCGKKQKQPVPYLVQYAVEQLVEYHGVKTISG